MLPRGFLPDTTYVVTRRCVQRQFFLLPVPDIQNFFLYCLAYAARRFDVRVHALCVMSNHFHLVGTDVFAQMPNFMQWLDCMLARGLNRFHGRRGYFWEGGSYNCVKPIEPGDVLDKMVYTVVNPVAAGLVPRGEDWPGLRTGTLEDGPETFHVTKPHLFFDPNNLDLPETVDLVVAPPEAFERLEEGVSYQEVVEQKEAEIRAKFEAEGRSFLGRKRVLEQKATDTPTTEEPRGRLRPHVACKNKELRILVLAALVRWREAYRQALKEFARGARDVLFPAGTYKMRVQFGVLCEKPEPG